MNRVPRKAELPSDCSLRPALSVQLQNLLHISTSEHLDASLLAFGGSVVLGVAQFQTGDFGSFLRRR